MTELLSENIASEVGFGDEDSQAWNPIYEYVTNKPPYDDGSWRKNSGYGFRVVRVIDEKVDDQLPNGWKPFILQINPQVLNQNEIFAIQVTPTFRGIVVEHQGSVLKDISISGTTGISPGRRGGGAKSDTGRPILAKGRSGYEEFHELRSYFRAYVEQKRLEVPQDGGELRLIFDNFRDHESIFVEPQKFNLKRDATRPFLYNYEIQLKGIGNATFQLKDLRPLDDIFETIDKVSNALNDVNNFIGGGIDLINRIERGIETTLIAPLQKMGDAIASIQTGAAVFDQAKLRLQSRVEGLHDRFNTNPTTTAGDTEEETVQTEQNASVQTSGNRQNITLSSFGVDVQFLEDLSSETLRIADNFADSIGINLDQYNSATDRTSTLVNSQVAITTKEHETIHGLIILIRTINLLLSQESLFSDELVSENNRVSALYDGTVSLITAGSTRVSTVLGGDTIQIIAARELNSVDRYRELIILNHLIPPYIASTSSTGILSPGDTILIPQFKLGDNLGTRRGKEYNVTAGLTEAEKALGVDIRLDKNFDIAFNNIGDFDIHAGMETFVQALVLRILTELRSLKRHPSYGTNTKVGSKIRNDNLTQIRNNILTSLQSDVRTESVNYLRVTFDGGTTLNVLAVVKPVKSNQTVPIPIKLNVAA